MNINYIEVTNSIAKILEENNQLHFVTQLNNAKLKGATGGEILAIICSLLKAYEEKYPSIFRLIKNEAYRLFGYSKELGMKPIANYDLLDELDN